MRTRFNVSVLFLLGIVTLLTAMNPVNKPLNHREKAPLSGHFLFVAEYVTIWDTVVMVYLCLIWTTIINS